MLVGACGKADGSSGANSKAAVWAARNTGATRGERQHRAQQQQRLGGRQQGWQQLRHYGGTTLSASKGQSVRVSQLECRRGVGVLRVAAAVAAEEWQRQQPRRRRRPQQQPRAQPQGSAPGQMLDLRAPVTCI